MRRLVVGSLIILGLAVASAQAADWPVKARPPLAPVAIWTGPYIGANIGYSWGRSRLTGAFTGTGGAVLASGSQNFDMDGVIIDSNPHHKISLRQFCERYGYKLSDEELIKKIYGRTHKE